ncbi:MAG: hypothetical protein WAM60_04485 [Candidatus Promineifilaceae bacterium]
MMSVFFLAACRPQEKVAVAASEQGSAINTVESADRKIFLNNGTGNNPLADAESADRKVFVSNAVAAPVQPADRESFYDGALYPAGH